MNRLLTLIGSKRGVPAGCRCSCERRNERGAELIELALILPLLLVVIAGIIDFGLLFQRYEVVTNAAREGARIAILPGYGQADVDFRVDQYVNAGIEGTAWSRTDVDPLTLQTVTPTGGGAPFQTVTVTVNYTDSYVILGPIISLIGGNSANFGQVTLRATSTMRVES